MVTGQQSCRMRRRGRQRTAYLATRPCVRRAQQMARLRRRVMMWCGLQPTAGVTNLRLQAAPMNALAGCRPLSYQSRCPLAFHPAGRRGRHRRSPRDWRVERRRRRTPMTPLLLSFLRSFKGSGDPDRATELKGWWPGQPTRLVRRSQPLATDPGNGRPTYVSRGRLMPVSPWLTRHRHRRRA